MGKANFTEDFKRDAVLQVSERGDPVAEVAARPGISKYSLYEWKKRYAQPVAATRDDDQAAEVGRLKREFQRVTEERDILKKRPRTSPRMQGEVRVHRRASSGVFDPGHVPSPVGKAQRLLCLAEGSAQPASAGTRDEARADVFDYIEVFYNPTRKHARNGMLSPVEFERQHKARAEGV